MIYNNMVLYLKIFPKNLDKSIQKEKMPKAMYLSILSMGIFKLGKS